MSRDTLLTPELHQALIKAYDEGAKDSIAAACVGIHYDTLRRWKKQGRETDDPNSPYFLLYTDIKKAEGRRALKWLSRIEEAGMESTKNWTSIAWLLERVHPEEYGKDSAALTEIANMHRDFLEAQHKKDEF
jgi:hypothetical protein